MTAPAIQFYDATDTTLQTATIATGSIAAGSSYGPTTYHLWNQKGGATSDPLSNAFLIAQAYDGTNWVTSGLPVVDEGWVKVSITGSANPGGDVSFAAQTTGYVPLSGTHPLSLSDIPRNCTRYLSVRIDVPSGGPDLTQNVRLVILYNQTSVPLSGLISLQSGPGIIVDWLDKSLRRFTNLTTPTSPLVVASGAQTVAVGDRYFVFDGAARYSIRQTVTLNQTSGSGALAVGQSYIATLSQADNTNAVTTTKGNAAASPTAAAVPADQILIGYVTVAYQGGGLSIINQGNVDLSALVFGEFCLYVPSGSGLTVTIGAGRAITSTDNEVVHTSPSTLAVPNNASSYIWLLSDGTVNYTATTTPTEVAAIQLGFVSTAAGAITNITLSTGGGVSEGPSTRIGSERFPMYLRYQGPLALTTKADYAILPYDAILESWAANWETNAAGPSPANDAVLDINYDLGGLTTIFTSQATVDNRPRLLAGVVLGGIYAGNRHEVRCRSFGYFAAGTKFSFDIDVIGGNVGIDVWVVLYFRRVPNHN